MDRGNVHDPTRDGGTPTQGHEGAACAEFGIGPADHAEKDREQQGRIATVIKGAFKIYLVPSMRAQKALATVVGGWSDLVAEARQEHEARKRTESSQGLSRRRGRIAGSGGGALDAKIAVKPGGAGTPREMDARRGRVAASRKGTRSISEPSPPLPGSAEEGRSETPPPTLIEFGESGVEVRPNPAASPPHATSGVAAHLPPEVRHKLTGGGPIRA